MLLKWITIHFNEPKALRATKETRLLARFLASKPG